MGVGARREIELLEDLLDMGLDGALSDDEALGDRVVGQTLGQQLEDFALAAGELFERARLAPPANQSRDGHGGDAHIARGRDGGADVWLAIPAAKEPLGRGFQAPFRATRP